MPSSASSWPRSSGEGKVPAGKVHHLDLWTLNGSGWGTIKEKILEKTFTGRQVYAVQEHHLEADKFDGVRQSMLRQGWQLGGSPAVVNYAEGARAGTTAGVAIAAPRHYGVAYLQDRETWDIAPK